MLPFVRPRASDCLRCQLRQLLRRASQTGLHYDGGIPRQDLQTRQVSTEAQHESSEPRQELRIRREIDDGDSQVTYKITSPSPLGKIRRNRGSRQREASQPLSIKSLGQDSEVIVLRDIPKRQGRHEHGHERLIEVADAQDAAKRLTAEDIESLFGKQRPPKQEEVNTAIEELRPREEVLSREDFDKSVRKLLMSFSLSQLARYLNSRVPASSLYPGNTTGHTKAVSLEGVQQVNRTKWYGGQTDLTVPVNPASRSAQAGKSSGSRRHSVAENIHRLLWNIQVEEEARTLGELELLLTPAQWGLLHTRDATGLFSVMRSRKFYQNSRFERDRDRGAIRIIGPRAEADNIGNLFEDAFRDAKSISVNLKPFADAVDQNINGGLSQTFSSDQLKRIMTATKTHIYLNVKRESLHIHGFNQGQIDDALRLTMAMLSLPSRKTMKLFARYDTESALVPVYSNKALPSPVRGLELGRLTSPSKQGAADAVTNWAILPQVGVSHELQEHIMQQPNPLSLPATPEEWPRAPDSYWSTSLRQSSWKATIGHVLYEMKHEPEAQQFRHLALRQESLRDQAPIFSPQSSGLSTILSYFELMTGSKKMPARSLSSQVIARLVPSPVTADGVRALVELPKMEFIFNFVGSYLHPQTQQNGSQQDSNATSNRVAFEIDDSTTVALGGVNAILHETVFDVSLPGKSADIRFARQTRSKAFTHRVMENEDMRTFVEAIVASIKAGGDLRAPQYLQVKLDPWMTPAKSESTSNATTTDKQDIKARPHTYFFAGFEYRVRRRYAPQKDFLASTSFSKDCVLDVHDIEGGLSGGRRTEFFVQRIKNNVRTDKKRSGTVKSAIATGPAAASSEAGTEPVAPSPQTDEHPEELIRTAFALVDMVDSVHRGTLTARKRLPVEARPKGAPPIRKGAPVRKSDRSK